MCFTVDFWTFAPWAGPSLSACCAPERPLKIRSCSLFLKLKKGEGEKGECSWSCGSDRCTAGVVPETLSFIEFYGPERFPPQLPPAVGRPELCRRLRCPPALRLTPAGVSPERWRAETAPACSPADRTGADRSPRRRNEQQTVKQTRTG